MSQLSDKDRYGRLSAFIADLKRLSHDDDENVADTPSEKAKEGDVDSS